MSQAPAAPPARRTPRALVLLAFMVVFTVGGFVGYAIHPSSAEETRGILHARVQECVAAFKETHLWPNSCPPINPAVTEAQLAIEALCPRGWAWDSVTGATCVDASANP